MRQVYLPEQNRDKPVCKFAIISLLTHSLNDAAENSARM